MSEVRPPHNTACSPNRSLSVSSLNVVCRTPARVEPRLVEVALRLIRRKDLNPIGSFSSLSRWQHGHAVCLRLLSARPLWIKADDYVIATVAQILRLGVALASVSENCNSLALQG